MEIGKRYIRTDKQGNETIVSIKTEQELNYHNDLQKEGFTYKEVKPVEARGSVCISCEG